MQIHPVAPLFMDDMREELLHDKGRVEWYRKVLTMMGRSNKVWCSSNSAGFALANIVFRTRNAKVVESENCFHIDYHCQLPSSRYDAPRSLILPDNVGTAAACGHLYSLASQKLYQKMTVMGVSDEQVVNALVARNLGKSSLYVRDFIVAKGFEKGYEGGSWKSVRRSLRKTTSTTRVMSLEEASAAILHLDPLWHTAVKAKKRVYHTISQWDGEKVSQLSWWAQNYATLQSYGLLVLPVGTYNAAGECYSIQLFCNQSNLSFHCFGRRHLVEQSEQHTVYEEMRVALEDPMFAGRMLNDGGGYLDLQHPLNLMKTRYSAGIVPSYQVDPL